MTSPFYTAHRELQRKRPEPPSYTGILSEARETTHKGLGEIINHSRDVAKYDAKRNAQMQRYINSPVPDECLDLGLSFRRSPSGPLSRQESESPDRVSRSSVPQPLPALTINLNSPMQENIVYPWELEPTPKAGAARGHGPVPRDQYVDPSPSLWGLGLRPHTALPQTGIYDMLQVIKDEDNPQLQGRPYEANLWVPLDNRDSRQRPSTSEPNTPSKGRTRMVWRPRPGLPGALACAPAGTAAMLAEVKDSFTFDLPALPMRRATYSGPPPITSPRPLSPISIQDPEPEPELNVSLSVDIPASPDATGGQEQDSERSSRPQSATSLPPARSAPSSRPATPPESPVAAQSSTKPAGRLPTIKRSVAATAGLGSTAQTVMAAKVWLGARGKVLNGQLVP